MRILPLIFVIVFAVGCSGPEKEVKDLSQSPKIKKQQLPPIPDNVTKKFVMDLWSQPNDENNIIKEVKSHVGKSGVWKISRKMGPNEDQYVENNEIEMVLKFSNQRYAIWEIINPETQNPMYSLITYDFEKEKYRWWEFGEDSMGNSYSVEYAGQLLEGLIEWESIVFPQEGGKVTIKEISKTNNRIEQIMKVYNEEEIVLAAKDVVTWSSELTKKKE